MSEKTITIPDETYQKLAERVEQKGDFSSVQEYVINILQQVVEKLQNQTKEKQDTPYSREDEEAVKKRLRNLGYLS